MQGNAGRIAASVLLTFVALVIGVAGIAVLIGVGEAANNVCAAFATVSFPFALLAAYFAWLMPSAHCQAVFAAGRSFFSEITSQASISPFPLTWTAPRGSQMKSSLIRS